MSRASSIFLLLSLIPAPSFAQSPAAVDSGGVTVPVVDRTLHYRVVVLSGADPLAALRASLGEPGLRATLALNRVDRAHARAGDSLVVPDPADWDLLTPFPRDLPSISHRRKFLLVSARIQAWAAYESGRLVRWGVASTGREDKPTPAGLLHTNWRARERTSTFNDEWKLRWYVNLDNRLGISLHQYELPGRPASHSCVRLLEEDARWLWSWAESWSLSPDGRRVLRPGTPVLVMDRYDFRAPRPWRALPREPDALTIPPERIEAVIARFAELAAPRVTPSDPVASPDSSRAR